MINQKSDGGQNVLIFLAFLSALLLSACGRTDSCDDVKPDDEQSLVISNSISNHQILSMAEDAQGHIWLATFRGLNRYVSKEFYQYFVTDDSTSIPDNHVAAVYRDSKNRLWVSTVNGTCIYTDEDNFRRIRLEADNRYIQQIAETRSGKMLFNTGSDIYAYNEKDDVIRPFIRGLDTSFYFARLFIDSKDVAWVVGNTSLKAYDTKTGKLIHTITLDRVPRTCYLRNGHELWIAFDNEMRLFDTTNRHFMPLPPALSLGRLTSATILAMTDYPYGGMVFSSTEGKLFYYNNRENAIIDQTEAGFPFEAPRFRVDKFFTDSQGNLWMGSVDQGFAVAYSQKDHFNADRYLQRLVDGHPVAAIASHDREVLVSTCHEGIIIYNTQTHASSRITLDQLLGSNRERRGDSYVRNFCVTRSGEVWLAVNDAGVLRCKMEGGRLTVVEHYDVTFPMHIIEDYLGTIWVTTASANVCYLLPGDKEFKSLQAFADNDFTFIPSITQLADGRILVAAFFRPFRTIDPRSRMVSDLPIREGDMKLAISRSVLIPTAVHQDRSGHVWIGTVSNGLLRYSLADSSLTSVRGTACNDISGIEEDQQGHIWVSTMSGMSKYDASTGRIANFFEPDGIGGNQFEDRASTILADGTLMFGGTHGVTAFNPMEVTNKHAYRVTFENLKIHSQLVRPSKGGPIEQSMALQPHIRLNHRQNGFSIAFAAIDYSDYDRVHFYYQMEGFDKYWIDAHNNREAFYANLPAGTYTFRVRATNIENNVVEDEKELTITISPAPWNSWWAWTIYLLLAFGLAILAVRITRNMQRERAAVRQAEFEKEQERRVNTMNMSFFANISHEFRTPLTMISGPITLLLHKDSVTNDDKRLLSIVGRSVDRMLRLVNQLMDFNKLEIDTLHLQVRRDNIIATLRPIVENFTVSTQAKDITLVSYGIEDSCLMWIDADKVDKIMTNLLSNALKFTPRGGRISVSFDIVPAETVTEELTGVAKRAQRYAKIVVADSGKGIPEGQLEIIFKRYYQVDNLGGGFNRGTGIGLYYARSLAMLHHGTLTASNRKEGSGSVFVLLLPLDDEFYTSEERAAIDETLKPVTSAELRVAAQLTLRNDSESKESDSSRPTVLVVDDDTDVVHYLRELLSPSYHVVYYFDAETAYQSMAKTAPDIVLSDVVMPGTNGYELCRRIKDDLQMCHIPVILVTAKNTVESQVEGLKTDADAYVTKPFEPTYLLALISSILTNRAKTRSHLSQATQMDEVSEDELSPQDEAFMTDLYHLMDQELANSELDVNSMAEILCISRTKFYYKVKGLTGLNPSTFFKTYKLNRAAKLLREGRYNSSEIAYMTGFSTPSHFSTSFKKQFGVTPSEYGSTVPKGKK